MDITPSPRILRMLGEIEFAEWQCIAELIDNALDDFTEIQKSGQPWPGGYVVTVTLPSNRAGIEDSEVVVKDTGRGMARSSLEKAVKAGWSSNDRFDKLGLFGMGFNVSTARLGNRTQVLSTQVGDPEWVGVEIDFAEISDDFQALDLTTSKTDLNEHGTIVRVSKLKRQQAEWLQRNAKQLREMLGRVYGWILSNSAVEIWVGGIQVKARNPCVWGDDRFVTYGSGNGAERVPAIIRLDQEFAPAESCADCGNWQEPDLGECKQCGGIELAYRIRRIHGWVGIQRHLDKREFGLDFLRNGRKILQSDKRVFDWTDPNDPVSGTLTEYPVDLAHFGGRIVGEIHLDHVPVTYSKDAFEYSDRGWRAAIDFLRGDGPILPRTAEQHGFPRNTSPIGRLVEGYRRPDAGRRSLVPGDGNGPIHELTREWAKKYWNGESDYLTDAKWWEAVESHEARKRANETPAKPVNPDEDAVLAALGAQRSKESPRVSPNGPDAENLDDGAAPGATAVLETLQERLDRLTRESSRIPELSIAFGLPDLGSVDVEAFLVNERPLENDEGSHTPVWVRPGAGKSVRAFFDPSHELFTRFGVAYGDALLIELVPYLRTRANTKATSAQIYSMLKAACLANTAVDFPALKSRAEELILEIKTRMFDHIALDSERAVQFLTPDERTAIESGLAADGVASTSLAWSDGTFILYAPALYLPRLVESWPEAFFDDLVFRSAFASINSPVARRIGVARVVGYLHDLATLVSAQIQPSTAQLQRAHWSCELLSNELA